MDIESLKEPINQLHWRILKTIILILGILPAQQGYMHLWQMSHESSQIVLGFFAISLFFSWLSLGFICALQMLQLPLSTVVFSDVEQRLIRYYKQVPMLLFVVLTAYLSSNYMSEILW